MNLQKAGFIGLGVIGGSLAKAIRQYYPDCQIVAFDKNKEALALAILEGTIHISCSGIDENFKNKVTVTELSRAVHLNPNYLSKIFKEYMGCSISQFVTNKRITEAKRLLKETDLKIDAIASAVGFYDSHHLQKSFKAGTGYSPVEYRKTV